MDGFIARKDGSLDWLQGPGEKGGEDFGYGAHMRRVDALVMGRATFDTVLGFEPWPYGEKLVVVLTHRPVKLPPNFRGRVESMAGRPATIVRRLAARGILRLYVDGGRTVQAFLRAGLIDEVIITRLPVLIGTGIPLFGPTGRDIQLRHRHTRSYDTGVVQSTYEAR